MADILVSIVVPVYNVEIYLDDCLKSVLAQTYSNLEIILVDDGSTDNSGAMCDAYMKIDSRIQVFHQKNGGLSAARNFGMRHASGKYIYFLDSDDYIEKNAIEELVKVAEDECADVVFLMAAYSIQIVKAMETKIVTCGQKDIRRNGAENSYWNCCAMIYIAQQFQCSFIKKNI